MLLALLKEKLSGLWHILARDHLLHCSEKWHSKLVLSSSNLFFPSEIPLNAWWAWWYQVKGWTWESWRSFPTLMILWFYNSMVTEASASACLPLDLYEAAFHLLDFSTTETWPLLWGKSLCLCPALLSCTPTSSTLLMNGHHCREAGALCQHRAALSKTHQPHAIHGQSGKGFSGDCELSKEN